MGRNTNTPKPAQEAVEQEAIEQPDYETLMEKITQFLDEKGIDKTEYQVIIIGPIDAMIHAQADLVLGLNEDLRNSGLFIIDKDALIAEKDMQIFAKDSEILLLKEQIDTYVETYLQGDQPEAKADIDPERARILASAQADIEELIAAKRKT